MSLVPALLLGGCGARYDSYGECMYDWKLDFNAAKSVCPQCDNDWDERFSKARKRCSKYMQPWE